MLLENTALDRKIFRLSTFYLRGTSWLEFDSKISLLNTPRLIAIVKPVAMPLEFFENFGNSLVGAIRRQNQ